MPTLDKLAVVLIETRDRIDGFSAQERDDLIETLCASK